MPQNKKHLLTLIPLVVSLLLLVLALVPGFRIFDFKIYDAFLGLKSSVPEAQEILVLEIDDLAIAQVGIWPWPRNIMADGIILLTEFELDTLVLDIEYVDPSPRGINSLVLEEQIPRSFQEAFGEISGVVNELFTAITQGFITLEEAREYISELEFITQDIKNILLDEVQAIARDNDAYLGIALGYMGNVWATVNMLPVEEELIHISPELRNFTKTRHQLQNFNPPENFVPSTSTATIQPTILPLLQYAGGASFPNVVVDDDGVRRRVSLIAESQDTYFGQLAFAPLLKYLGNPRIDIQGNNLVLRDAVIPGQEAQDIRIPQDPEGFFMIHWPKKLFADSFRHLSFNDLVAHDRLELNLVRNLRIMDEARYLDYLDKPYSLIALHDYTQEVRQEIFRILQEDPGNTRGDLHQEYLMEYREARKDFYRDIQELISGGVEQAILSDIDGILAREDLPPALTMEYQAVRRDVVNTFDQFTEDANRILTIRERLGNHVPGSFAVVGQTGISTTDVGVNPFEKQFMNVGTHAAVANTILQNQFLTTLPWWIGSIVGLILSLGIFYLVQNLKPIQGVTLGFAFILVVLIIGFTIFIFTGIYVPMLVPMLSVILTSVILTLMNFIQAEGDKSFLRNAFGRYLSTEVIKQIVDNPDKLNLGGVKKHLTAIFTDVKGFSTISEVLDPTDLVTLLNRYLTGMSDIILDHRGTIDKYEGDAIIAFFGAPIDFSDHAALACQSAIRMKKLEEALNREFLAENLAPSPLLTRIGINTGDMVVGNMGTLKKMDYTIMGSAVNLAARLEGVNKQYGTWILTSGATKELAGPEFVFRMLDRVRVVGINEPVRLYDVLDEKNQAPRETFDLVDRFHEALGQFEEKNWTKAQKLFNAILQDFPEDGPSKVFVKRCQEYRSKAPAANWDGVFNLTTK